MRQKGEAVAANGMRSIRVLVADDSAVMRGVYRRLFLSFAETRRRNGLNAIELCGIAEDGVACVEAVRSLRPDVVVLDVEMPRMHGLDVLRRLREEHPALSVILCSSSTEFGARITLEALALGANDYVTKPGTWSNGVSGMDALGEQLLPKLAMLEGLRRDSTSDAPELCGTVAQRRCVGDAGGCGRNPMEIAVLGVSTGGPSALEAILPKLPATFPVPLLIAQHMPKLFTRALAERLDRCCALKVQEAYEGAKVRCGLVLLAPGDAHMEIVEESRSGPGTTYAVRLRRETERNFCTPSVDVLFRSAARTHGAGTLALVMTGMGTDGLAGARAVHQAGGIVLAQDEATSAVWGMPGRVFDAGIAQRLLPLEEIADELIARASSPAGYGVSKPPEREIGTAPSVAAPARGTHGL